MDFKKFTKDMVELDYMGGEVLTFIVKGDSDKKSGFSIKIASMQLGEEPMLGSIVSAYYCEETKKIYAEIEPDK